MMIWISFFRKWASETKWYGDLRVHKRRIFTQRGKWTPWVLLDVKKYRKGDNRSGDGD